jgi:hypothetical protein
LSKICDIPPAGKAVGIAVVAVLAVIVAEGLGIIGPPAQLVAGIRAQTSNFFSRLFNKPSAT